jgi:hypothetical protein
MVEKNKPMITYKKSIVAATSTLYLDLLTR